VTTISCPAFRSAIKDGFWIAVSIAAEAQTALGCERTGEGGFGLIVSGIHDFDGDASAYVDLAWTHD
jgi:hypothetical protein